MASPLDVCLRAMTKHTPASAASLRPGPFWQSGLELRKKIISPDILQILWIVSEFWKAAKCREQESLWGSDINNSRNVYWVVTTRVAVKALRHDCHWLILIFSENFPRTREQTYVARGGTQDATDIKQKESVILLSGDTSCWQHGVDHWWAGGDRPYQCSNSSWHLSIIKSKLSLTSQQTSQISKLLGTKVWEVIYS